MLCVLKQIALHNHVRGVTIPDPTLRVEPNIDNDSTWHDADVELRTFELIRRVSWMQRGRSYKTWTARRRLRDPTTRLIDLQASRT